ncbi:MAG: hypothetical protein WA118_04095 [Carboxydocellales bacterium]
MSNEPFEIIKVELDAAITEAEEEYSSDNQLMDAREALSDLKKKHFG